MTKLRLLPPGVIPRFPLGNVVMTAEAFKRLEIEDVSDALARHCQCDWGEVCSPDWDWNNQSLDTGDRLLSVYRDRDETTFWIITEADRSATTVLLPDDY